MQTTASARRPLPTKAELDDLQSKWARHGMPFPRERSVVDLVRDQARIRPRALAVKDGDHILTFGELQRQSNQVANWLLRAGLELEDIVALPLPRSCTFVVGALGVLKAGGSYLPIDTGIPTQRFHWFLDDAQSKFAITHPDLRNVLAALRERRGHVLVLDADAKSLAGVSTAPPPIPPDPGRRAYVIYTSGSTGKPKGVEIEHHSLTNLIYTLHRAFGLTPADRGTLCLNTSFDASVTDTWSCLCAGGVSLVPPAPVVTDPDGLIRWLTAERVTFAALPTALTHLLLTRPWPNKVALRFLRTGGEALHARPPAGLPFRLVNEYGPTENTVISTWTVVDPGPDTDRPSIGKATGNVKTYVLGEDGEPVSPGEPGELYLGGEQVARGYLNRSNLSQERFFADPFASRPGARMYRTGDWVRWRPDGGLDFLGRHDDQVQVRGRRIEVGEIEQQLRTYPGVKQACCQPVYSGESATHMVAHIAVETQQLKLSDALRKYLRDRLPAYMVPTGFVFHERLPLTSRGKIDREALRSQSPANLSALEGLFPPESLERKIADLWCRVVPNAPSADCFATLDELGGDSLQAVELLVGVEKITGKRLVLSDFLLNPTLLRLIRLATSELATHDQPLCTLNQGRGRPPVFCVYGINGDISHYLALAEVLGDDQPVFGLRLPRLNKRIQLPTSMQEAGEQALECIQAITPGKAPVVVGYSWSGALAFEIARQWLLRENATPFVAMISSPAPPRPRCLAFCAWHFLRWTPAWVWKKAKEGTDWSPGWIVRNFRRFLGLWINDPTIDKSWVPDEDEAPQAIARPLLAMHDSYHPTVAAPIDIHMFRETEVPLHPHPLIPFREDYLPDLGWTYWAGRAVNVHWINADHDTLIRDPAVSILAAELRAVLDRYNAKQ